MPTLFGIPNCDTVKKARRWLEQQQVDYRFHDFRRDGLDKKQLSEWLKKVDWSELLNRRSRTWRELAEQDKQDLTADKAVKLMVANPSLIKRPVLVNNKQVTLGFDQATYKKLFS